MRASLYEPLGLDRPDRRSARRLSVGDLAAGAALALVLAASGLASFGQGQFGREDLGAPQASAAPPAPVAIAAPVPRRPEPPAPTVIRGVGPDDFAAATATFEVFDPGSLRQPAMIAHRPEPDLVEDSAYGPLPIRAADGRRPFDVYSAPWSGVAGRRVAIVVGGLGISQTGTQAAIARLPAGVTFAFAPAGNSLDRWMQEARRAGHELLMQVPMEPVGYPQVDPGENTLTIASARAGAFEALYAALGRTTNYVGITNYMGGHFATDPGAMQGLMDELSRRGLMYLDDSSALRSLSKDAALQAGVPAAAASLVLDRSQDPADIAAALDQLEALARAEGTAIGVASAFDTSVAAIAAWSAEARKRGVEIVPVSALAFDPGAR